MVEGYLETGQPVGSRTLADAGGFTISPASIRNVMHELETLGLLASPHTSAGRLPTDIGLRLFVDGMMRVAEPSAEERAAIEGRAVRVGPVEEALAATTAALSGLSACAGLVLVPKAELVLRSISFVPLSPVRALAVIVGDDGQVENRVVDLAPGTSPSALVEAGNYMSATLVGADAGRGARAARPPARRRPLGARHRRGGAGRTGHRGVERGWRPPPGADRARAGAA